MNISFKDNSTIHRTVGETLRLEALVQTEKDHNEIVVEAWAPIIDETPRAIPLQYQEETSEGTLFSTTIQLTHTGRIPFKLRSRTKTDTTWKWNDQQIVCWCNPDYVKEAITYNAFVRYFGGRKVTEDGQIKRIKSGTFHDVKEHLAQLKEMGVSILYLNPVHQIGELFKNYNPHDLLPSYLQPGCPYSVKDYRSIDSELSFGTEETEEHPLTEFKKLVDAAHSLGIRVYMDLVFNHSAHDSVFQRLHPEWFLYKEDPWSIEEPYIYPEEIDDGKPWGDPKHTFSPYDHGHWWRDTAQLNWNNLHSLPEDIFPHNKATNKPPKNPTIDSMYTYFMNIVKYWVREFGIDGFRCDVAYRIPTDFWEECIQEARKTAKKYGDENGSLDKDVVFIAEDYHVNIEELLEAGFTACYGDFSNKLHSLPQITGYLDYMYNINGKNVPDGSQFFIFPECHDFHRNPTKIAQEYRDSHRDADLNANKSRWTITATVPGIPMIFNGFEKIEWEPASLFSYSSIDWESDKDISEHIKKVNMIRNHEPALQRGGYHYVHTSEGITHESKIFSFIRHYKDQVILVAVNIDIAEKAEHIELYLPEQHLPHEGTLKDLMYHKEYTYTDRVLPVTLEPGEAHIFKLQ